MYVPSSMYSRKHVLFCFHAEVRVDDNHVQPRTVRHRGRVHSVLRRAPPSPSRRPLQAAPVVRQPRQRAAGALGNELR